MLDQLRLSGSLKALFPRPHSTALDVVTLNTAGGVTAGDRFATDITALPGTQTTITTQAAERVYRTETDEIGKVETRLSLQAGAKLNWLPQETILFDRARLSRRLSIELDADAEALIVEPIVFGRQAMGEEITRLFFKDNWRIRQNGKLIYADATRIIGDATSILNQSATGAQARAMASIVLISPNAEAGLNTLRAALPDGAGASLIRPGVLAARLLAPDSFTMRRSLIPTITELTGSPIPKTWTL